MSMIIVLCNYGFVDEEDVLRLEVGVGEVVSVEKLHAFQEASEDLLHQLHCKLSRLVQPEYII